MKTGIAIQVLELRNYLVRSNTRDRFQQYFEEHFIASQEALGGYPLGQYHVKDEPDRFFWIRGFANMATRSAFLPAFYGGPVWKQFGPAANDMMLEWHQVHLLKPLNGPVSSDVLSKPKGLLAIDYYIAKNECLDELAAFFRSQYLPFLQASGIREPSLWVSETSENDFPRLPVIQNSNLLVTLTPFSGDDFYREKIKTTHFNSFGSRNKLAELVAAKETVLLYPAGND